ncbi:hypothetical protein N1851_009427 [Merluccius polli]|uniref:Uncharacterized protein n=1 Tax=Merluccius polli TaxID=89951 RepID=A0AA47N0A2_MERPO|nr:hypothetical protein N1851_009427 [Merluccius polli]
MSWRDGLDLTHDSFVFRESSIGRLAAASRGEWRLLGDSGVLFGLNSLHQWLTLKISTRPTVWPGPVHRRAHNREVEVALQMPPQVRRGGAPVLTREVVRCDLCDSNVT